MRSSPSADLWVCYQGGLLAGLYITLSAARLKYPSVWELSFYILHYKGVRLCMLVIEWKLWVGYVGCYTRLAVINPNVINT